MVIPSNSHVTAPVAAGTTIKPEWLRVPDASRIFGIGRSKLYEMISERAIKSVCLRERGKVQGIRLISFDSLAAYIENAAAEDEAEAIKSKGAKAE